jgi:hypothetical protein
MLPRSLFILGSDWNARCRKWNWIVLSSVCVAAVIVAAGNYCVNIYGLFGDIKGKQFIVYDNERTTKYLFSYKYIPANFDGLLIGSSISANWDTRKISSFRIYNASIDGANISEETLIADNVLQKGRPKILLVLIFPYLTETYGRKSRYMNPQEYWGALGSVQLFRVYFSKWLLSVRHEAGEFNDFGYKNYEVPHRDPSWIKRSEFFADPQSLQEYRDLLQLARVRGVRIVGIIPPIEMQRLKLEGRAFDIYHRNLRSFFLPDEPIIDLNGPVLDQMRKNKDNFPDGYHLSKAAADQVIGVIDAQLAQLLRIPN